MINREKSFSIAPYSPMAYERSVKGWDRNGDGFKQIIQSFPGVSLDIIP